MKIFLDTANIKSIKFYNDMGLIDGVTTNPSLLAKEKDNPHKIMKSISNMIDNGDVSLEVIGTTSSEMIKEGRQLKQYGDNVVVKCPMTADGLIACKKLTSENIPVNITLIFSSNQAILAAKSGAKYISPFIGRLDDIGNDGINIIGEIKQIFQNYDYNTQILVASVRHPMHVIQSAKIGADAITMPPKILDKMIQHNLTTIGLNNFLSDWKKIK